MYSKSDVEQLKELPELKQLGIRHNPVSDTPGFNEHVSVTEAAYVLSTTLATDTSDVTGPAAA